MKKLLSIFYTLVFVAGIQTASVTHAGDTATGMAENAIRVAMLEEGVEGKLKISINGHENGFNLREELGAYRVDVRELNLNEKTRNFKASIAFVTQNNKAKPYELTGSYDRVINIPALAQKMARDAVIKEEDIALIEIPEGQVKFDTITKAEKLVGQSLKRAMPDNTPIKERDIQKTQVISRNSTINILFNTPAISLKATGIALDNGGVGDTIRVRNSSSNKIIQAVIQDEENVSVLNQGNNLIGKTAKVEGGNYVR